MDNIAAGNHIVYSISHITFLFFFRLHLVFRLGGYRLIPESIGSYWPFSVGGNGAFA